MAKIQKQAKRKANRTAFKPGQCGNPKGRPKKAGSLLEALEHAGNPTKMAKVSDTVWTHAIRGESWAINLLLDRFHGKVADRHQITGDEGGPVKFTIAMETDADGD